MTLHFNSIVIGGGTAGLAVGALLAKRGYKPVILERDPRLGGRTSSFEYRGYLIDTGSHQFASWSRSGMKALFDEVGAEDLNLVPIRPSIMRYDVTTKKYTKASGRDSLGEKAYEDFKKIVATIAGLSKEEIDASHGITAETWLLKQVKNGELLDFFRRITGFAGQGLEVLPAGCLLETLNNSFNAEIGIGYPQKGGCIAFSNALEVAIKRHGGEVMKEIIVDKIKFKGNKAQGIIGRRIESGGQMIMEIDIDAPIVVCTMPISRLFSLIPREKVSKTFAEKVDGFESKPYAGILAGVDASLLEGFGDGEQFFQFTAGRKGESWHALVTIPTYVDKDLAPKGRHYIICNSHGMLPKSQEHMIPELHKKLRELLSQMWPNFNDAIDWISEIVYYGAAFAPRMGTTGKDSAAGCVDSLKGMYLAGDGACPGASGGVGSAVKSAWVCMADIEKKA